MPSEDGKFLKIKYLMQIKSRPPTFYLYVNNKDILNESFLRFIRHQLIEEFSLHGSPVRILVRDVSVSYRQKGGAGDRKSVV